MLAGRSRSAGEPCAEVVEDLDRRPLECGCNAVRYLPQQHDARHGHVVGRDAAESGQQLVLTSCPPSSRQARVTRS